MLLESLMLLPPIGLALLWHGRRIHERAVGHARAACRRHGLELLDQTVVIERRRAVRTAQGRRVLERHFGFECSPDGTHRDRGRVVMRGTTLASIDFPYLRDAEGRRVFLH